jgi:acyl-CoA thioesterase I
MWRKITHNRTIFVIAVVLLTTAMAGAHAETIQIVAFGDSGVFGSGQGRTHGGVPVTEAYPAKLERALRARGWNVSVSNQGIPGMMTGNALYYLDRSVPPLTKITIVQLGSNDRGLHGVLAGTIASNLAEIIGRLHAKGSSVILVRQWPLSDTASYAVASQSADVRAEWYAGTHSDNGSLRSEYNSGDGSHLNAAGTDLIVARAVPDVERLLLKLGFRPAR